MNAESGGSTPMDDGGHTNESLVDLQGLDFDFVTSTENENIWCEQCKVLKQELQKLQQEHSLNYTTLKKKVISTDLLIKKYKAKCEDHDTQSKTMEDMTKKMEQLQRESSTLNVQLSSSLQQIEPLKKAKHALETEVKQKVKEIQTLQDKLTASLAVRKQYESLAKSTTSEKEKTEEERKTNSKRLKDLQASFNKQEQLVSKLKDENKALKAEHADAMKKQKKLQQRLKVSLERFDKYWAILKEHDLIPKGEKRLRTSTHLDTDESDLEELEEVDDVSPPFVSCHVMPENTGPGENDKDSDEESLLWTFSPIVHVLSPLPPSPAPPRQCDSPVDGLSQSDEDSRALESKLQQNHRKKLKKQKNQVKGKKDISVMKSVEGRLLRRQSATVIDNELHLSEEEKLDETLVPESKKLQGLKDNSNCNLRKDDDLVRTSDTAIHTTPEEEESVEIISPRRRRNSSRIVSDSDSDTGGNFTNSSQKRSQDLEQSGVSTNKKQAEGQNQGKSCTKSGIRYSLRRSPRCDDMVPLGKRLTRSMSSPIKVSPKGGNSDRRHSPRLSLSSEMEFSKNEDSSKMPNTHKGSSKTKLDLEKLKRDYKAMQSSHRIQNSVEDDANSHLFTRSKSKTILPTSGAKGRKNVVTANTTDILVDTKANPSASVIRSFKQKENSEESVSNIGVDKNRNGDTERTDNHSDRMKGRVMQEEDKQGTQNSEEKVTERQNADKTETERQSGDKIETRRQSGDKIETGRQNGDKIETERQNGDKIETERQNCDTENTGQNSETEGTEKISSKLQDGHLEQVSDNLKCDKKDATEQENNQTEVAASDKMTNGETETCQDKTLDNCAVHNSDLFSVPSFNGEEGESEARESCRSVVSRQSSTGFILKPSASIDSVTDQTFTPPQSPSPKSKSSESLQLGQTVNKHSSESACFSISKHSEGAANNGSRCHNEVFEKDHNSKVDIIDQTKPVDRTSTLKTRVENGENMAESVSLVKDSFLCKEDSVESCDNLGADNYLNRPSASTDTELSLPVYIPFSSHSSQNIHSNVTSSTVISPETSQDGSTISGSVRVGHSSSSSLQTASPVSPLPPSPIDFIIPFALSPLPPSPIHEQDPLSPLPGSPWDEDSAPTANIGLSRLANLPSSDNSSENTPVVTPVPSFLAAKSESPIPITCGPAGEKAGHSLCSFHAEAPSGAIYVKPKAVPNKRSADLNITQHSKPKICRAEVNQPTAKHRVEKTLAAKRKSTDKLPSLVSPEKKLCLVKSTSGSQSATRISPGSKRSQESPKISALVLNVIQMLMEQYMDSTEMSTSKAAESLLAADKDVVVVLSTWIHWLVQHLLCSTVESLALLKPVYDGGQDASSDQCPFLADQEVKMLQLYSELQQRKLLDNLKQKVLDSIWSSLSLSNLLPVMGASALSRMYTGICRLNGDVESVRVMVHQLLVTTSLPFHSLGVAIAGVWPLVLYKAKKDEHSMVTVVEQSVTRTLTTGKQDDEKLLECYYRLCNWCRVTSDSHILSKQLLSAMGRETRATKPCQGKIYSLMRSLELLFVKEPVEFYLMHGGLNSVCQKCTKPRKVRTGDTNDQAFDPEYTKCVFKLLGCVLPKKRDARIKNINQSVKNLQKVLKSNVCVDVQICVVETLLELCVLTPSLILNILHDWYNTHRSQVPHSLLQKISWTRETMLKKYPVLKCQPFI
ncbi:uncharacterized protein LOC117342000 [Pecten maximus]|uniref:uncharacterized protein LOC117342000 n=1 Tax=Pecten maximus TaxID=6579 RepID=UPI001457FD05|nr:uncharacterized protein LOC117342000 [Pecten maximus]